ncbi:GRB2-associated-binding protein 1-like isoform X5 [Polyodon spathula]|uniref:GRB2-associated-binding protein 1-like isoform X5 n=1 Tax=Polyodon spathula TaxID=7913 RepID=UPI001B7F66A6|nr:GRB2-associated-binding protein 1-like isoform X5 [Polyodon spathula]
MLLKSGVVESKQQSEQAQHKESFLLLIKAWKKRWFVLRSGRLTGDPDVLEYYKNDHTKKPIRVIDLNLCEQVDAGLTFNKKDLEHSFIFDIKTIDRVFYLVADTEEEMNKWVRCICDICGFNPTDEESGKHPNQCGNTVVEVPLFSTPSMMGASSIGSLPPPYQPVNVRHLESSSSQEEPQDYLWLSNCESKRLEPASQASSFATEEGEEEYLLLEDFESKKAPLPSQPHADSSKSTSSETDCNDNVPSHKPPAATPIPTSSKPASVNGFFPQPILYDSPPSRAVSVSTESSLYNLPRSYSQDPVLLPTKATSSPPVTDSEDIYVFNTPSRKSSVETQLRQFSISYDIPPAPGGGSTYQIPRTGCPEMVVGQSASLPDVPPPRPPKPSVTVPERSPTETYSVPRSVSETDSNYCIPTGPGKSLRSNTLATVDSSRLWKDHGPQDCYDIPRTFPTDRSSSLDLNESFNSYLKNKGMVAIVGGLSASTEEMDENYVHMSANSPSHHHSRSLSEPIQEPNYMPMTPGTTEFSSLGKQVPPPAHMGFRSSPKTPPRRTLLISDCQPPPVDRNLKPDRKVKPAPLEIKPMPEWEEFQAPVRSPVTRTFARDSSRFPMPLRPPSVHSTASSTDSQDSDENYVAMNSSQSADEPNVKLGAQLSADGGSSPMVKPKGDKQVEYLDLDLDSGKSTPPRKKKSNGTSNTSSDERVDYVVVDQQRTQALKNTREAWNDGRQSTESEAPSKGTK